MIDSRIKLDLWLAILIVIGTATLRCISIGNGRSLQNTLIHLVMLDHLLF